MLKATGPILFYVQVRKMHLQIHPWSHGCPSEYNSAAISSQEIPSWPWPGLEFGLFPFCERYTRRWFYWPIPPFLCLSTGMYWENVSCSSRAWALGSMRHRAWRDLRMAGRKVGLCLNSCFPPQLLSYQVNLVVNRICIQKRCQMVSVLQSKFRQRENRAIKNITRSQKPSSALWSSDTLCPRRCHILSPQPALLTSHTNAHIWLLPTGVCAAMVINFHCCVVFHSLWFTEFLWWFYHVQFGAVTKKAAIDSPLCVLCESV